MRFFAYKQSIACDQERTAGIAQKHLLFRTISLFLLAGCFKQGVTKLQWYKRQGFIPNKINRLVSKCGERILKKQ